MKRSRLARRRRFLLFGLFAAVAIAGCDRAVDTATLIDRATAFRAQGDVESALIELRNAVQQAPGNQTARALLAAVFVDKAAGFRAADDLHGSIGALESALRWHAGDQLARAELAQDYLDMAARMAARGDHATRIAALKGAVTTAPKNGEARLRLGAAYLEANAAEDAAKELQRAEQNGIERFRLVAPLGEAWLRLAEYERLLGTFHPDDPMLADDRPLVYALRGRALAGIGDIAGSRAAFWHALRADPANVAALVGLARLAIDSGDLATAEARLTAAAAHTPRSPRVLALQAELQQGLSNYGKATTAYRALLQIEPGNVSARLGLALVEILGGNLERAIAEIEPRLAQLPADPNANYLRGLAAYLLRDYPTAARHADVALVGAPGHLPTKLLRGATAAAARDHETAVLYLDDVVAADPGHRTARRLLGQALLQVGQADAALTVLRPLDGLNVDDTALIGVIGDAAIGAGDLLLGETYYRRLAALQPDRADLRVRLGAVQAARGRVEEGMHDIEAALGTDPTFGSAHAALTMAHLQANDHAAALASANRLIEHAPGSATGHMLAGYASLRTGQPDRARRQLGEALSIDPTNGQAARLLASLLVGSDTDTARAHLEAALAAAPRDVDLLRSLAELELGANDAAAAEVRFEQLVAVAPAALAPRIALARLYLLRGAPRQALAVTENRLADHGGNLALLDVVGRGRLAVGRTQGAIGVLRPLATALPRSAAAQYALARAYELAGNRVLRRVRLRAALAADPGHARASLELGRLLLADGDGAGVAALVARLREAAPDHPFVSEVDGYDALRQGRHVDAVSLLARAADQAPWSNLAVALADAQHAAGLAQASIETLEAWLAEAPNDDPVRFVLSNRYIGQQRFENALAALQTLAARAPDNVFVLNNIAWLRMTLGDATGAARYAERALAVDGRDPKVLDTAASIQLALGRTDRAAALWLRALAVEPDNSAYRENLSRAVSAVSSGAE